MTERKQKAPKKNAPVVLEEASLDQIAGGRKAGEGQKDYLIVKLHDAR